MSTINEALKKAQEQKQQKPPEQLLSAPQKEQTFQPPLKETAPGPATKRQPFGLSAKSKFLLFAAITAVIVGIYILSAMYTNKSAVRQMAQSAEPVTVLPLVAVKPPQTSAQPSSVQQAQPETPAPPDRNFA